MTYAQHRKIIDVDSHVIELRDFLAKAAREADLELLPQIDDQAVLPINEKRYQDGLKVYKQRQTDPELMAEYEAKVVTDNLGGWSRLGAHDPKERSRAMDLFGYSMQWVLPTFSFHQVAHSSDPAVLEAGSRTLNKAMGDFCAQDERLKAIGYVPLTLGPEKALELMSQGFEDGCYTFMVDTNEPNDEKISFSHPDFDPVWARFVEMGVPFGVHVAANGHYKAVPESFKNNGKQLLELGGDAPAGELGLVTINNSAAIFLASLIFDGVFERHPNLKGVCMEHGAFWVPSWMKAMDFTMKSYFTRRKFAEKPSVTAAKHLKFSPFAGEPLSWIMDSIGTDMLVYASDFPHPEGTSSPIEKFEAELEGCSQDVLDAFYYKNMEQLMGVTL